MEKPKMTPAPLLIEEYFKRLLKTEDHLMIDNGNDPRAVQEIRSNVEQLHRIKEAMLYIINRDEDKKQTAVNCTYGAGLNPEKIQELIESVDFYIESVEGTKSNGNKMTDLSECYKKIKNALNNIKYK